MTDLEKIAVQVLKIETETETAIHDIHTARKRLDNAETALRKVKQHKAEVLEKLRALMDPGTSDSAVADHK